jgi:type II secretory pathway pseudopilin PulG
MKTFRHLHPHPRRGLTLIEMSLVLFLLVALLSTGLFFSTAISNWKRAREASEVLRNVYVAQRTYLADYPIATVATLTQAKLLPYLPNNPAAFPTVTSLTGAQLQIKVTVSPPVIDAGNGTTYDPSGNSKDSLWDVGE